MRRAMGLAAPIAFVLVGLAAGACWGMSEAEYDRAVAAAKAIDIVSGPQLEQARRVEPGRALQVSGVVNGRFAVGETRAILLRLVDGAAVEIAYEEEPEEARIGFRVRCLVEPSDGSGRSRLNLVAITGDSTPLEVLRRAALSALKFPPTDPAEIARSAEELRRTAPMPTRAGDPTLLIKRAIAHLNPRLTPREVDVMSESIVTYSTRYRVDPYLVVAVIAAESRFNPNARSYKGAMGLGQLMPATAAAHGVDDPYDPVENLEVAIRIIRRNLDKYGESDWNRALAAYNAGCGAVDRYGGVPPYRETRNYLWAIYEYWCWMNGVKPEPRPR